ncbi:MAG: long-chain fatty acid--CoA ligase [Verrucomicrobiae bacterium]
MNKELSNYATRLRELIRQHELFAGEQPWHGQFDELAIELFALQFTNNPAYRKLCEARQLTLQTVQHWKQIPAVPTSAFKELELTSIPAEDYTSVFYSSGTTEQKPSRHFHCPESLAIYEASLWQWFQIRFDHKVEFLFLTPNAKQAPHSSLVHMFDTVRQKFGLPESAFLADLGADGSWVLDFESILKRLELACLLGKPVELLGTAFSFVHLVDCLTEQNRSFQLPEGSRVMETGGYKNRSRSMPKTELHGLITDRLGVPRENILCEYGMSELSSQAYDSEVYLPSAIRHPRVFRFPPWARVQIISPETGKEVADGETGLIRIFDLANVFSVAAIQAEDLGVRRGDGFELIGRAQLAEPRGCSLMTA